ncbi:DUF1064 domain-containing protein [Oceanobacillus luteolus]|uniref:DUF1064 domain-containing protein n=1 Tax=Oceanobacillus luteolus TaxID=1274358 RepID=UPI00203AF6FF|nr:DUF1064 domain-containing protein [Oceanobacillus luteolus]MCM3739219.1 DUF1064 domain-containing protein [Oceanobacillus luteolus]
MKRRRRNKYNARKVEFQGMEFDSKAEWEFYMLLKNDKLVKDIELHPEYTIIEPYKVECGRCDGRGRTFNKRTGNFNKCTLCRGYGTREKAGAKYTADFKVTYVDGLEEIIDVKGGPVSKDFPLRRKLFEIAAGKELIIAKKTKNGWEVK